MSTTRLPGTHRIVHYRPGSTVPGYVTGRVDIGWVSHNPADAETYTERAATQTAAQLRRALSGSHGRIEVEPIPVATTPEGETDAVH